MGTLYDELNAQPQTINAAPTGASLYDELEEEERQERAVRGSLTATANTTPERAAQLNYLSQVTGMPRAVVETDEGAAKSVAQLREIWEASADSPVLRAKLANPTFTEMAKDDVGVLSQIERGVQATTRYLMGADGRGGLQGDMKAGFHRSSAASAGAFRAVAETLAVPFDFLEEFTSIGGNPLRRLAEGFDSIAQGQTAIADRTTSGVFGVSSGVQSLVQNSKYLPLVAAGPPGVAAALTGMVSESFGSSYQTARDRGVSQLSSFIYGASDAAIEYATERLPLQRLIGDLAVDTGFVRMLGRQIALEVPGEQIATVLQDMNEWAVLNPERSFRDYLADRPSAAAETLIATVIGVGGNVALTKGIDTALNGYLQEQLAQTEAGQQAIAMQQLLATAAQSKLRERDPAQFRETMAEMARQAGTESVYIDAAVLNQMPPEVLQQVPGLAEQLADALATNSAVEVKLADVLTAVPGTGLEQAVVNNVRMSPDALTATEAQAAAQEAQGLIQQEAARVMQQATDAVQAQANAETVKQTILGELNTTARFGQDVNDAYATLVRDFYTVLGQRLGINPLQAYQRYPLRVVGQSQAPASTVLEQPSLPPSAMEIDAVMGIPMSEVIAQAATAVGEASFQARVQERVAAGQDPQQAALEVAREIVAMQRRAQSSVVQESEQLRGILDDDTLAAVQQALGAYAKARADDTLSAEEITTAREILTPMLEAAAEAKPAFDQAVREISEQFGTQPLLSKVKGFDRAAVKLMRETAIEEGGAPIPGRVNDLLRATIVVDSPDQVEAAIEAIANRFDVVRVKNRFKEPLPTLYRDVLMTVRTEEGVDAEIQINVPEMLVAKDSGHKLYEMSRSLPEGDARRADLEALQTEIYAAAFERSALRAKNSRELAATAMNPASDMNAPVRGPLGSMPGSAMSDSPSSEARNQDPSGNLTNSSPEKSATNVQPGGKESGNFIEKPPGGKSILPPRENLEQRARGTFNPAKLLITLNDNADLSTFLHETGHFFWEVTADVAAMPDAPADVVADMQTVLDWFGVPDLVTWRTMTLDQKRPHHERFAESFEQYLLEGRAPSRDLRAVFRKFRNFLVRVYRSLQQFAEGRDLRLSDDVRSVMDRMLAVDEQIAEAHALARMSPDQAATDEAVEKLQARSLRDMKWATNARSKAISKMQAKARSLRKGIEAEARAEVGEQPVYRAMQWLRQDTKLSIDGLESLYMGDGDRYALLDWKPLTDRRMAGKEGVHPDVAADMFGFENGDAMVRAILQARPMSAVVQDLTDQRMLERHGDLVDERAVEEAAIEAVHNEARARALATELAAQRELTSNRRATGQLAVGGQPLTVNATLEAARQFAVDLAGRKRIADLKSAAYSHLQAERRAAKAWTRATTTGDTQAAVDAKQDQLLNHEVYRALQEAQDQVQKAEDLFRRVLRGTPERLVDRGYDPDVVAATRSILAAYGLAPRLGKTAIEYLETVERNDPEMYGVLKGPIEATLAHAKPYDQLTVDELDALVAEIEAMQQLARRSRQMEVDGNLMNLEEAVDRITGRLEAIGVPKEGPGERSAITKQEERKSWLQSARALTRRMEQWSEAMDGGRGAFTKLVYGPVKAAADRYRADRVKFRKQYQALINDVAPALRKGEIAAPELGYTFGKGHNGIGHAELLHAIIHTGNESNKRKLLLGRRWASENPDGSLDTSRWDAFIERMHRDGVLGKAHYDFVQGVWDLLESIKPIAQKAHRDVFGRYFDEITANAFETPFGAYRGGYAPAQADPRIVTDAALRRMAEMENENMAFSFPSTNRGFTKGRVEYNRPLMLDLRTVGQHIDKVLLFSHMEPAVRDVNRLLRDKGVNSKLSRIDPAAYEGALIPWLNRSARQQVETPIVGDGRISRVLSVMRNRAGMALMFANVSNTAQQITGFATAAVKVRPRLLLQAAAQYVANPKKTAEFVAEHSIAMRDRMQNEIAAVNDAMDAILLDPSTYEKAQAWTQRHAYFLQAAVDNVMSPIVWTGAYNQALEAGESEADAIKAGDAAVRQTQGSTLPEDVSRIETGPAPLRMFTQFVSYFNMMANTNGAELTKIARDVGLKRGAGRALYVVTMGLLVPLWVAEAIAIAFRGGPEDEDEDGWYLDDWIAAVIGMGTIKGTLAMVPFVGQAVNAGIARTNDNPIDDRISLSPAVSLLESSVGAPTSVYKALAEDGNARTAVRDVASAISLATGLPLYAVARPLGYLAGMADDRIAPTDGLDMARGLLTGAVSPESRQ